MRKLASQLAVGFALLCLYAPFAQANEVNLFTFEEIEEFVEENTPSTVSYEMTLDTTATCGSEESDPCNTCDTTCDTSCECDASCETSCGCEPSCGISEDCCAKPSCGVPACLSTPSLFHQFRDIRSMFSLNCVRTKGSCSLISHCDAPGCDSCDLSCDSCDLDSCCEPCLRCCSGWTVWAESMFLRRSTADPLVLISDQNTGGSILNATNLEFDHRAVPRVHLMYETACCWGIEGGFFGIDSWSTHGQGGNSPVLTGPGLPFPSTGPGTIYQVNYSSELISAELNLRRRWNECLTMLAGFRYFEFNDDFLASATAPVVEEMYEIDADNQMYGFQVGGDAELINRGGPFHIDSLVRLGVFYNNADQSTYAPALTPLIPATVDRISARADDAVFMAEIGLRGVFELSNDLSIYGGYHILWLDGIALAPDQIPVTDMLAPGSASLDTGGTLYFHGATVGLQASF